MSVLFQSNEVLLCCPGNPCIMDFREDVIQRLRDVPLWIVIFDLAQI